MERHGFWLVVLLKVKQESLKYDDVTIKDSPETHHMKRDAKFISSRLVTHYT